MKPGWKTSEFWITAAGQLLALLALLGGVAPSDRDRLDAAVANAITAAFALAGSFTVMAQYVRSRTVLKNDQSTSARP